MTPARTNAGPRYCDDCGEVVISGWVYDEDLDGHLCVPCAEDEYGMPAEEWYAR